MVSPGASATTPNSLPPPHSSESSGVVTIASATTSSNSPGAKTTIPASSDSSRVATTVPATSPSPPISTGVVTTAIVVTTSSAGVVNTVTLSSSSLSLSAQLQSESSSAPVPAPTTPNDTPASRRNRSFVPGAIVGSLVGTLLLGVCVFFYIRHRRQRRDYVVTPLEHCLQQQQQQHKKDALKDLNDLETAPSSAQLSPEPEETSALPELNQENGNGNGTIMGDSTTDYDHDVRVEVAEIRMTMGRMMDHVHRMESRIGSRRRDTESIASSDGPPPAYGS
ncbi:hypothetical protein D9757_012975 [Collybiopsis confluens]|uniref:Uncharacterized protein n=1 Tax=Collybiopsis confluens TaxID=2823264 RepID=A0A8H5LQ98_9AGAR|nr:hypothetical protein D9757_012975 [Collybiopsis confluens]